MVLIDDAAARGRERAESMMFDLCRIFRRAVEWDPVTAADVPTELQLYAGVCRVRPAGTQANAAESSGAPLAVFPYVVSVPFAVTGVGLGDLVTVTVSRDPNLAGKTLRVEGVESGTFVTARRLSCGEESR